MSTSTINNLNPDNLANKPAESDPPIKMGISGLTQPQTKKEALPPREPKEVNQPTPISGKPQAEPAFSPKLSTPASEAAANSATSRPLRPKSDVIRMQTTQKTKKSGRAYLPIFAVILSILLGFMFYKYIFENVNFLSPIPGKDNNEEVGTVVDENSRFENPLNGMYFSNEEANNFKDKKPIAVMVNNYVIARPSAGLSQADVVYEAVAEGGITRIMPIFWSRIPEKVSSIRSARYYFVELASAYHPHYVHWGAAHVPDCQKAGTCPEETEPSVDAYSKIVQLGIANLDAGNYACSNDAPECTFGRDSQKLNNNIPLEHTGFVRLPSVYAKAKEVRVEDSWHKYIPMPVQWKFKDDAPMEDRGIIGEISPITYNYWDTMAGFNVKWEYDKENNEYVRYQGDVKQVDANNNQDIRAKSVIVRFTKQELVGDKKSHLYHDIEGAGDALIFQDGKVIQAKWTRNDVEELDSYSDLNGNEVEFVRGQIWVQLVPIGNQVNYETTAPQT